MATTKQDINGYRTPEDVARRYKLGEINLNTKDIEELKKAIICDTQLSITSTAPVQNKVITAALNNKVNKEEGKGLSSNDFTDAYVQQIEDLAEEIGTIEGNIPEDSIKRWNNLAYYANGGNIDVNTTTERLVLSKLNTPDTSFWFVETFFYSSISDTSNRTQVAYAYNRDKPAMQRYYNNGTWSAWSATNFIEKNISDYEGYIWYADGTLEQWGRVNIAPTAANTVTSQEITFPKAFDYAPDISAIPQTNTPDAITTGVGSGSTDAIAKEKMYIYMTRTNTSATTYRWRAKGYKNPF